MSGMELQKRESKKMGLKAAGAGVVAVLGFAVVPTFFGTLLGIASLGYALYMGRKWWKHRAEWGMRF